MSGPKAYAGKDKVRNLLMPPQRPPAWGAFVLNNFVGLSPHDNLKIVGLAPKEICGEVGATGPEQIQVNDF